MKQKEFIVDDLQRVIEVTGATFPEEKAPFQLAYKEIKKPSHQGQRYHPSFIYKTEEEAMGEITDRHKRLSEALTKRDMVGCLSINKEPYRKSLGFSKKELEDAANQDKARYKEWVESLELRYREIHKENPDHIKLAKTLKMASAISNALQEPLALDFIEIMDRMARIEKAKEKSKEEPSL
jgi:hypothetical protein